MNYFYKRLLSQQLHVLLAFFLKKTQRGLLLVFSMYLYACHEDDRRFNNQIAARNLNDLVHLEIPWSEIGNKIHVDSIVTDLKYLKLENTSESFLVEIDKVIEFNDTYLVYDKLGEHSIFHFDKDGKYLKKFNKYSPGFKGEISIQDFDVDKKNNLLYIADSRNKVYAFDIRSGEYKGSLISDDIRLRNLAVKDSSIFIYSSGACGNQYCNDFYKVNFEFEIDFADLPIKDDLKNIGHYSPGNLKALGDKIFISTLFNDTLFQVMDSTIKPLLFVDFKENIIDIPPNGSINVTQYIIKESLKGRTAGIENYFITKNYFYFNFLYNMSLYSAYYSIEEESLIISDKIVSDDGSIFGPIVGAMPDEDVLISWIPSEPLYQANQSITNEKMLNLDTTSSFMKAILETNEVDNPILILVDLK